MMHVGISVANPDGGECAVVIRVSGGYNPDVLDDAKSRAIEAFNELFISDGAETEEIGRAHV